jgi:hypothetical protein
MQPQPRFINRSGLIARDDLCWELSVRIEDFAAGLQDFLTCERQSGQEK